MLSICSTSGVGLGARVRTNIPMLVAPVPSIARMPGPLPKRVCALSHHQATATRLTASTASSSGFDTINDSVLRAARDPSVSLLAQQVLEAEAELKAMFNPGRPMPSAGVVAKKRLHISDMKSLLTAKLSVADTPSDPDASDSEAERARLLFLEVERSLQRQQRQQRPHDGPDPEICFELALLEAENEQLREKAEALIKYQQQLEDVAEKHGLISFKDGQLVWKKGQKAIAGGPAAVKDRLEQAAISAASRLTTQQ